MGMYYTCTNDVSHCSLHNYMNSFPTNTALQDEIQAVNDRLMSLYDSGDADGVSKLYTTNCLLLPPDTDIYSGQFGKPYIHRTSRDEVNSVSAPLQPRPRVRMSDI